MNYEELTEDEIGRLMKNNTILDGKTMDYCYKIMEQVIDDMTLPEKIAECKKFMDIIEDRVHINKEKMIMRRGMLKDSDPLAKFMSQETKLDTSLEDQLKKLQLQVDQLMKPVPRPSSLRRQVTSSRV